MLLHCHCKLQMVAPVSRHFKMPVVNPTPQRMVSTNEKMSESPPRAPLKSQAPTLKHSMCYNAAAVATDWPAASDSVSYAGPLLPPAGCTADTAIALSVAELWQKGRVAVSLGTC